MDSRIIGLTIIFNKRNKKDEGIKTSNSTFPRIMKRYKKSTLKETICNTTLIKGRSF